VEIIKKGKISAKKHSVIEIHLYLTIGFNFFSNGLRKVANMAAKMSGKIKWEPMYNSQPAPREAVMTAASLMEVFSILISSFYN